MFSAAIASALKSAFSLFSVGAAGDYTSVTRAFTSWLLVRERRIAKQSASDSALSWRPWRCRLGIGRRVKWRALCRRTACRHRNLTKSQGTRSKTVGPVDRQANLKVPRLHRRRCQPTFPTSHLERRHRLKRHHREGPRHPARARRRTEVTGRPTLTVGTARGLPLIELPGNLANDDALVTLIRKLLNT